MNGRPWDGPSLRVEQPDANACRWPIKLDKDETIQKPLKLTE